MSTFIEDLRKSLTEQAGGLMRLRKCSEVEAWEAVRESARANLADSIETSQESYWRAATEVADRMLMDVRGFTSVGAEARYR